MQKKEVQEIPLDLILEPAAAVRTQVVMEGLESLADSIREVGVVQPIRVIPREGKFEIESGHRRFLASQMAKCATIPSIVLDDKSADPDVVKFHENYFREAVSPVDEGRWFIRLIEEKKWSAKEVARFCSRSEAFVLSRMNIVQGDERVLAALEAGQIGFSQGVEILRASDDGVRGELLRIAIDNGATVSSLRLMRFDFERVLRARSGESEPTSRVPASYPESRHMIECPSCAGSYDVNQIYPVSLCKTCYDGLLAGFQEARGG